MNNRLSGGILFVLQHPAHVHQFKNVFYRCAEYGLSAHIAACRKDVTTELLDEIGIQYVTLGSSKHSFVGKTLDILPQVLRLWGLARELGIDVIVSRGNIAASIFSAFSSAKHLIFADSEPVFIDRVLIRTADLFVTPLAFRRYYGRKHLKVPSYKELSYLHPDVFVPNREVLSMLDLGAGERMFIVRFVAWRAGHDVGQCGFTPYRKRALIDFLSSRGRVYITSEASLDPDLNDYRFPLPPSWLHHALAFADLFVGDSQTMASEAAVLGVPAVRYNSFVGDNDMGNFVVLEKEYGLLHNVSSFEDCLQTIDDIILDPMALAKHQARRRQFLDQVVDMNDAVMDAIVSLIEEHP